MSYLWMMRLFSCGANHPQVFSQRRSSPLDSVFHTCGSASSSHCFNVGETEHSYLFAFAKAHAFSAKKNACIAIWMRVDTCFYNLFLMSDPCKFRIIIMIAPFPKKKKNILVRNLSGHVENHTASNNHGLFFSWGLMYVYALVNSPPMEIIFLLPDICTRKENNFEICCTIFS